MSAGLGIEEKLSSTQAMLCPCCGRTILRVASECGCGARFVGEPLDHPPIHVQRLGPALTAVALLLLVVMAGIGVTKWLAFAGLLVIWAAWRAVRLARRDPKWYGGYKTAATTLTVSLAAGATLAAYGIAHVPQAWDNYRLRQKAFTQSEMHHVANLLEEYKRANSGYPKDVQEYKKVIGESLPADYWDSGLKYQGYPGALADRSVRNIRVPIDNFELRSAGPDGIIDTDDDIIMRDGIFFTNAEIKKQPVTQQLR